MPPAPREIGVRGEGKLQQLRASFAQSVSSSVHVAQIVRGHNNLFLSVHSATSLMHLLFPSPPIPSCKQSTFQVSPIPSEFPPGICFNFDPILTFYFSSRVSFQNTSASCILSLCFGLRLEAREADSFWRKLHTPGPYLKFAMGKFPLGVSRDQGGASPNQPPPNTHHGGRVSAPTVLLSTSALNVMHYWLMQADQKNAFKGPIYTPVPDSLLFLYRVTLPTNVIPWVCLNML